MSPPMDVDTRDRVIALERDVKHLSEQVEELTTAVNGLTTLLNQTRGGWRVLIALMTAAGTVGGFLSQFIPWSSIIR